MNVGIDRLSFYTSRYYVELKDLATARGIDPNKYITGLGQEKMAVLPHDEDIVTLAATSAKQCLEGVDRDSIALLLLATESGIDHSKAAGTWVHDLLKLPSRCRVVELKQACYGGCAALQMALAYVTRHPDKKVLLIATDVARYGLHTPGEPTQGCGAAAMLISQDPKLATIEPETGAYTSHVFDFWRPNYRHEALVDGKFSTKVYLEALTNCWQEYQIAANRPYDEHYRFCYHIPFTRMAEKAHERLSKIVGLSSSNLSQVNDSLHYSRLLGNSYTASLFIGLASLLEQSKEDLENKRIGFFSYGSGCVAEFFSAVVNPGYKQHLKKEIHEQLLKNREQLNVSDYERYYTFRLPEDGTHFITERSNTNSFRLKEIKDHQRVYE